MDIRNIAIVAHVDHGKTTLVDGMLKQTHTFRDNEAEMLQETILDSNELEREKGITILAKTTSVFFNSTKINIIDTPGHTDFSGEVERVINMADGALLVVDAAEGPLPQTTFVTAKALERNIPIIVLVNKIDRADARPEEVVHEIEELFLHLASQDSHLNFPLLYSISREGKAWTELPPNPQSPGNLGPLFEAILKVVPPPDVDTEKPFKMLISNLDFDDHKGTLAIGKVSQGVIKKGQSVAVFTHKEKVATGKIEYIFTSHGLKREEVDVSTPGDIISLAGLPDVAIGQTITEANVTEGYPSINISEPTLKIIISPNTSPFAGKEGKFVTARQIQSRLSKEKKTNIGLKIAEAEGSSSFTVAGRGELHLAVLLESLRREGFELQVSKPEVILKEIDGVVNEPFEELTIEIDQAFMGIITEEMGKRKAELLDTKTNDRGTTTMLYRISSANLLGFRGNILTKTRGNGIFSSQVIGYLPQKPRLSQSRNGVLVSLETGPATSYALETAQNRGKTFITPGTIVYGGMIIGLSNQPDDVEINICKTKKLTNMHASNSDIAVHLDAAQTLSLEQCLDFMVDDELLEITPLSTRLRKKYLSKTERIRASRGANLTV